MRHRRSRHSLPSGTEVLYVADSPLRHPLVFLGEIKRDLLLSRELGWRLLVRDLRAQYRQSFLGAVWAVVPPVVAAAGFTLASNSGVIRVGSTGLPYTAYVLFSMTLWQSFTEALNAPLQAVTTAKPMLARIKLPREALLLAKFGEVLFNFGIKLILIVATFLWFEMPISLWAFLAPAALLHLILLGFGLGMLLACVGGLYHDVARGLPFATLFWLMLTPVVYPVPSEGAFAILVRLNPVTPLLVTTRELATTGVVSDPIGFWAASTFTVLCLALSWVGFRVAMPFIIERVSA